MSRRLRTRARRSPLIAVALVAGWIGVDSLPAAAQPFNNSRYGPAQPRVAPPKTLKTIGGTEAAKRLLNASSIDDRVRGAKRLARIGTDGALDDLIRKLETDTSGGASKAKLRLVTARALAPRAKRPEVRRALLKLMTGVGENDDQPDYNALTRGTAALALASSGHRRAMNVLGKALLQEGPAARAAGEAIVAYPPKKLSKLLSTRGTPSVALVEVLQSLGDQRAFHRLRSYVRFGGPQVRGAAVVALTRLGHFETVPVARHWLKQSGAKTPDLLISAAEVLSLAHHPEAPVAIGKLLDKEATRAAGLRLALAAPTPGLLKPLTPLVTSKNRPDADAAIAAVGRLGTPGAVKLLSKLIASEASPAAVHSLARSPGPDAAKAFAALLSKTSTKSPERLRLLILGATLRRVVLGKPVDGVTAAIDRLSGCSTCDGDAVVGFARSVHDPDSIVSMLGHKNPAFARGAMLAAPWLGTSSLVRAAQRLERTDAKQARWYGLALLEPTAADRVSTKRLRELFRAGDATTLIAARALAARLNDDLRKPIGKMLASGDPWLRAHAALGLGRAHHSEAVGMLATRYEFERDAQVRHALIVALSQRTEPTARKTIRLAASLDPNRRVRTAARLALNGQKLNDSPRGHGAIWLNLEGPGGAPTGFDVAVRVAPGVALPLVPISDGVAIAAGLPLGSVEARVYAVPKDPTPAPKATEVPANPAEPPAADAGADPADAGTDAAEHDDDDDDEELAEE